MRLSEAIRRGAKLRPQCKTKWFDGVGSCAWGAAYEGLYGVPAIGGFISCHRRIYNYFPKEFNELHFRIACMNDAGQTREQCADYAEKWEREHGLWPEKVWTLSDTRAWLDMQYKQLPREVAA